MRGTIHEVPPGRYKVADVFEGLERSRTLGVLYPDEGDRLAVVRDTSLVVSEERMYGHVDDEDGAIWLGQEHLTKGDRTTVYLDMLHELVHVKQLKEGGDLYDRRYAYVDRPTEVEAYALVVEEARGLRMTEEKIADYLYVEWALPQDHERLCRRLGVNPEGRRKPPLER